MARTDEQIKKEIIDQLFWNSSVDASDVKVEVSNGKVTLSGSVPNYVARGTAVMEAWSVNGTTEIENRLVVSYPPEVTLPTDPEIRVKAEDILAWTPSVGSDDIQVSVSGGVVTLEGSVDAYWRKRKAENLVSELTGVLDVENNLAVVPTGSIVDKSIAESIMAVLQRNPFIDTERIGVTVTSGEVTLTGPVSSWQAYRTVYRAAKFTPGVIDVQNKLVMDL